MPENESAVQPLALVWYERLMPGSQLVNRLQDLNYRVTVLADPGELASQAAAGGALFVMVDLVSRRHTVAEAIAALRRDSATDHLPVIAYASEREAGLLDTARAAGASLVVTDTALMKHLEPLLQQALTME